MSPGPMLPHNAQNPDHDHAWDNGPFAVLLLAAAANAWPENEAQAPSSSLLSFFCELEPMARRALNFVNRTDTDTGGATPYLVYNNPHSPNCTYGFTDTVAKTGSLLFTSLLYIDASRQMAALAQVACKLVLMTIQTSA